MVATIPLMVLFLLLGVSGSPSGGPPSDPARSRANYEAVVAHLDIGGDLMVAANTDGLVESVVEGLCGWAAMMPERGLGQEAKRAFDRLPQFIADSGLSAADGFGMSLLPRGDGLNALKVFVRRDPAATGLPLWRAMVGGAPRELKSLDYLPADTVLARIGGGEPGQLFKLLSDAVRQVGGPDSARAFDGALAQAGAVLGTNVEAVVASLGADAFFAIQLSATQTLAIPVPAAGGQAEPLTIPLPSLLVGSAVRDDTLPAVLRRLLAGHQVPCVTSQVAGVTLISVPVPAAAPYPLNPTYAVHGGMLLLGTTPEAVKAALSAAANKDGLRGTPAFKQAFQGQPVKNNGISFADRRFAETLAQVQSRVLRSALGGPGSRSGALAPLGQVTGSHLLVTVNEKDGISVSGVTSAGTLQTLRSVTIMPVAALLGAVAVPNFMHARSVTTRGDCADNLRLLADAKEMWALAYDKAEGAAVVEAEVVKFLRGGAMPLCPQGGRYTLGPLGKPPACSHPGHGLP